MTDNEDVPAAGYRLRAAGYFYVNPCLHTAPRRQAGAGAV